MCICLASTDKKRVPGKLVLESEDDVFLPLEKRKDDNWNNTLKNMAKRNLSNEGTK